LKIIKQKNFDLPKFLEENKLIIKSHLEKYLEIRFPQTIWEAMRYTVLSNGKMIRPVLTLESARVCGGEIENVIPAACAIEMIHSQSLIHDDLPCMDNDDHRRGNPTNHKAFGEATAVLTGDALISLAYQVIIENTPEKIDRNAVLQTLLELSKAAGPSGIVAGQIIDIQSENRDIDFATLDYIHIHKTGTLFKCAMRTGAILSSASAEKLKALTEYGQLIGYAFQIADDILDIKGTKESLGKTPGKDKISGKNTHPLLYGLSGSIEEVERLCSSAQQILIENNLDSPALIGIAGGITLKVTG